MLVGVLVDVTVLVGVIVGVTVLVGVIVGVTVFVGVGVGVRQVTSRKSTHPFASTTFTII